MRNLPFISIIVPVYNGENCVGNCIESLLNQDYPKSQYEIIMVDNKSKDKTKEIIRRYPVQYLLEDKMQGPGAARNKGAEMVQGEMIAFLDADQIADKTWLKNLIAGWEDPQYGAFGGANVYLEKSPLATKINPPNKEIENGEHLSTFQLGGGNSAYHRDIFQALNGFDTSLFNGEDFDLAWRMANVLGRKIKFNYQAIVYQKGRTIKEHLKREFRIGFGMHQFNRKHPGLEMSLWTGTLKTTQRTILGVAALIWGLFKPLSNVSRREHLLTILFDMAMRWANLLGRYQCFLSGGRRLFSADW